MKGRSMRLRTLSGALSGTLLATLAVLVLAGPAAAEIVAPDWRADGSFEHSAELAPGKFLEVCGKLPKAAQVGWQFEASAAVDFNIHYHLGKAVVYPAKLAHSPGASGRLEAELEQDYCWMWSNKGKVPARISLKLLRG